MRADALFLHRLVTAVALSSSLLVLQHALAAQEVDKTPLDEPLLDETLLDEFYTSSGLESYAEARYADDGRRDPFVPLVGPQGGSPATGPRFDQLRVTGVFRGSPGNSLVVLEDAANRGWFVRVGETVGNALLVDILEDGAVFEVRDYASIRREIVRLDRDERLPGRKPAVGRRDPAGPPATAAEAPRPEAPSEKIQGGETP